MCNNWEKEYSNQFVCNNKMYDGTGEYLVEGTGYAKYKVDDAHVARIIVR